MGRARTWLGVVVSMSAVNGTWTNIRHGTDGRAPPLHHASLSLSAITDTVPPVSPLFPSLSCYLSAVLKRGASACDMPQMRRSCNKLRN